MSIKVLDMVADRVLKQTPKAVLSAMATHASDNGEGIWACNKTVADRAGISRETASRNIQRLLDMKLIEQTGNKPIKTRSNTNSFTRIYRINLQVLNRLPLTETAQQHLAYLQNQDVTEDHNQNSGCDFQASGCDARTPLDVTEDHTNPHKPLEPSPSSEGEALFNIFWKAYPRTTAQKRDMSFRQWKTLTKSEKQKAVDALKPLKSLMRNMKDGGWLPHVYLRDKEFNRVNVPLKSHNPVHIPEKGTPARDVYDVVYPEHGIEGWKSWFADCDYKGRAIYPKTKYKADQIILRFGTFLGSRGFSIQKPGQDQRTG